MVKDVVGVLTAIVVVAGLAVTFKPGSAAGGVIKASGDAFSGAVRAATGA